MVKTTLEKVVCELAQLECIKSRSPNRPEYPITHPSTGVPCLRPSSLVLVLYPPLASTNPLSSSATQEPTISSPLPPQATYRPFLPLFSAAASLSATATFSAAISICRIAALALLLPPSFGPPLLAALSSSFFAPGPFAPELVIVGAGMRCRRLVCASR